jgi:hypothetical protein
VGSSIRSLPPDSRCPTAEIGTSLPKLGVCWCYHECWSLSRNRWRSRSCERLAIFRGYTTRQGNPTEVYRSHSPLHEGVNNRGTDHEKQDGQESASAASTPRSGKYTTLLFVGVREVRCHSLSKVDNNNLSPQGRKARIPGFGEHRSHIPVLRTFRPGIVSKLLLLHQHASGTPPRNLAVLRQTRPSSS